MDILVLDTIHGGEVIARHLFLEGHHVDMVDIYRHEKGIPENEAARNHYDLVIAPVHLTPDHPLLHLPGTRAISHHEAVAWILEGAAPHPSIEITGGRGKTTTAHAIARLLAGPGILHTSDGTWQYPEKVRLRKRSITPASLIEAAADARSRNGWLVAEESLGVAGFGDIAVLTSGEDYPIAAGKKRALDEKARLLSRSESVVVAPGVACDLENAVHADEIVRCTGNTCHFRGNGIEGTFSHPLLVTDAYRIPLMTAAAVACLLGIDPSPLEAMEALEGRMSARHQDGRLVLDNANSGTNKETTIEAARYARELSGDDAIVLVIGIESRTVCEGFAAEDIMDAVFAVRPSHVIVVGGDALIKELMADSGIPCDRATDLDQGRDLALASGKPGTIILAVKTWR